MGQDWSTSPAGSLGQAWIQSQPCSVLRLAGTTFPFATTHAVRHAADVELYSSTALHSALHLYSSAALYTLHPLQPSLNFRVVWYC